MRTLHRLAAVALLGAAGATHAALPPATGAWRTFEFAEAGSSWTLPAGGETAGPTDFSGFSTLPLRLDIVDLGLAGDRFEVFLGGLSLGLSSLPGAADATVYLEGDEDRAFADGRFSAASFVLPAGDLDVELRALLSPEGGGIGAFRLSELPEPADWLLMGTGLAMLGAFARRRAPRPDGRLA